MADLPSRGTRASRTAASSYRGTAVSWTGSTRSCCSYPLSYWLFKLFLGW
ncbi:MAG: hypothetical protein MZU79_03485 [Anaerotruncus sp.]|nr:hypothetical protein [Anaerotruncus sp.]